MMINQSINLAYVVTSKHYMPFSEQYHAHCVFLGYSPPIFFYPKKQKKNIFLRAMAGYWLA